MKSHYCTCLVKTGVQVYMALWVVLSVAMIAVVLQVIKLFLIILQNLNHFSSFILFSCDVLVRGFTNLNPQIAFRRFFSKILFLQFQSSVIQFVRAAMETESFHQLDFDVMRR